jgi:hypothetical protein
MNSQEIEKIGVRELRADIPKYLYGDKPLEIVRHGHTVGYYFPVRHKNKAAEIEALKTVAEECQKMLAQYRVSEDEIIAPISRNETCR